jgi:hypothetical protein
MIHYRIHRPYMDCVDGPYPREAVWQELGLSHLLPLQLTGTQWPVQQHDGGFTIGRGITPGDWVRISDHLEIGWASPPTPAALARERLIPGITVTDPHGNAWTIPNANPQSALCSIPKEIEWTVDGPDLQIDNRYRPVVDLCAELFEAIVAMETIDRVWAAAQALRILQINYRIGTPELVALQRSGINVLDNNTATKIVLWFVDFELVNDVAKKK